MMSVSSIICFQALEICKNANGDSLLQQWGMTLATMGNDSCNNGDSLLQQWGFTGVCPQ